MRKERGIILGAGLAGLSAAVETGFPVFEKYELPGGTAASIRRDGFVFDVGIHVLQSKDPVFNDLMTDLNVAFTQHHRKAWIYNNGKYAAYPFQVNTSHLPWRHRLRCLAGFLGRSDKGTPVTYGDWILQNFGAGFAELFMIPYAEKFWRVSPWDMTYEWAVQRVPQPRVSDIIKGAFRNHETNLGTNPVFTYPEAYGAGFGAIAEAFLPRVRELNLGLEATALDQAARVLEFDGGELSVGFDRLITTLPLPELIKLIKHVPEDVATAVRRLSCNAIAVVNLGVGRQIGNDWHWAHYPDHDISFFRISFPHTFGEGLVPAGTCSIQAEVSYDRNAPPQREELLCRVRADLVKVGILDADAPVIYTDVLYQEYGYVIYDHYRIAAVKTIHDYLKTVGIFPCGRYGAWEYLWSDEAIMSGRNTAQLALADD